MFTLAAAGVAVRGRTLLHPVDLALAGTGLVGLIGHNGSGKSTLLRLLARQVAPSSGSIRFGDRPLASWGARAFARQVAYLPQDQPVAAGLRVRELVALGRYAWHGALGRIGAAGRAAVERAMERTGVLPLAERDVTELSGGERQRAWIAMCVAQEARWLLLDEPTAALDLRHQRVVLELLQELSRAHGVGIVVVLHDLNLAARYCDDLVALRQGRLIAHERPDAMMTAPLLGDIFGVELGLLPHPGGHPPIAYLP